MESAPKLYEISAAPYVRHVVYVISPDILPVKGSWFVRDGDVYAKVRNEGMVMFAFERARCGHMFRAVHADGVVDRRGRLPRKYDCGYE